MGKPYFQNDSQKPSSAFYPKFVIICHINMPMNI